MFENVCVIFVTLLLKSFDATKRRTIESKKDTKDKAQA
jgi:hypothetical protein